MSNKVVEEDWSLQPGQVKPWTQPLSTTKRSEATTANIFVLSPQNHPQLRTLIKGRRKKKQKRTIKQVISPRWRKGFSSYLPPPWVELIRPVILAFIKMDRPKICENAPSFWYPMSLYLHILHGLPHHPYNNVSQP